MWKDGHTGSTLVGCQELSKTGIQGVSPNPAEDAATRTLAMETLAATRKQLIIQLQDLIPHVSVTLCQHASNLVFYSF